MAATSVQKLILKEHRIRASIKDEPNKFLNVKSKLYAHATRDSQQNIISLTDLGELTRNHLDKKMKPCMAELEKR